MNCRLARKGWLPLTFGIALLALSAGPGLESVSAEANPSGTTASTVVEGLPESSRPKVTIDGSSYTGEDLVLYTKYLVGQNIENVSEVEPFVPEFVLDHVAYDEALRANPGLADSIRVKAGVRKFLVKVYAPSFLGRVRGETKPSRGDLLAKLPDPKPRYELSVIVSEDEEALPEVTGALTRGEPFEQVAERYSRGISSENGGRMPPIEEGNYTIFSEEEFGNIRPLKKGEVSKPFRTRIGWVVVKLNDYQTTAEIKEKDLDKNYAMYVEAERDRAVRVAELDKEKQIGQRTVALHVGGENSLPGLARLQHRGRRALEHAAGDSGDSQGDD